MSVRNALRTMLKSGETIVAPGGYDALTTRIVEYLGFKVVYMGGQITGYHLGTTEPLTSMTEQVANAAWATRLLRIPLIVDGAGGWGDAVHTYRCVREFEFAGVSGIHLEDQLFPKREHYHVGHEHIISLEEWIQKLKVALEARSDPDFIIIARTDAIKAEGGSMAEAVRRGNAAAEAGVDVVMPMLREPEDMEIFRKEVPNIPLVQLLGFNSISVQQAVDLGYQVIIYPIPSAIAAVGGVMDIYSQLKETGEIKYDPDRANTIRLAIEAAINFPKYLEIEAKTTEVEGA